MTQTHQNKYFPIAMELSALLDKKQQSYGDAFGSMEQIFKILYPEGIKEYQYADVLTLVRMLDKVFRIANTTEGESDLMGEEPYKDIAGYALLALARCKENNA